MQSKAKYLSNLERVHAAKQPTEIGGLFEVLFPHLNETQQARVMDEVSLGWDVYIAAPPVRVDNTYHVVKLGYTGPGGRGSSRSECVNYIMAQDISRTDILDPNHKFIAFARDYARTHWGNELIQVDMSWKEYASIELQDPLALDQDGFPASIMTLYFTLNRTWSSILHDISAPSSQVINAAIGEVTHFAVIGKELKGNRNGSRYYNCYQCGGGLSLTHCNGCGAEFADKGFRIGWNTPLPQKLIEYLELIGDEINPVLARESERQKWLVEHKEIVEELGTGNGKQS